MRMAELIEKKRDGGELTREELAFLVQGVTEGTIPDYQTAAWLMAVYFRGLTPAETAALTLEMADSGDRADLSAIRGVKVDKHSTGGVGDKTTFIAGPIAAACGVKIAKMSGRGLGHTGGTADKLESIPGFRTAIPRQEFFDIVNRTGMALVGNTGNLCPADKKLYALRDVTGTVESTGLIASSVMSKKIAAGADAILLDVKVGAGAFMKTLADARTLAREMVEIGNRAGRRTVALLTEMEEPLGRCVGNALEVREACEILRNDPGRDPRLTALCLELAAQMVLLAGLAGTLDEARAQAAEALSSGRAMERFRATVAAQGGDVSCLGQPEKLALSPVRWEVPAPAGGFVTALNAELCGQAAVDLGAGRETKESAVDPGAGMVLNKKRGDPVEAGEPLAALYGGTEEQCRRAAERFLSGVGIGEAPPAETPLILERIE